MEVCDDSQEQPEYTGDASIFFTWCLILPTAALACSLALFWLAAGPDSTGILSLKMIDDFIRYYDRLLIFIAVVTGSLSFGIGKNIILTLAGIILPHGLPELLVFSLAGAAGMEITRKMLSKGRTKLFSVKLLGLLLLLTAGCAFVEVYFTPKVFAFFIS